MNIDKIVADLLPVVYLLLGAWLNHRASHHKSPLPEIKLPSVGGGKHSKPEAPKGPQVRL